MAVRYQSAVVLRVSCGLVLLALAACSGGGGGSGSGAPVATSGALNVTEDIAASGTLLASDPSGKPLTFQIVSNGTRGSAVITNNATGAYTYTPNANATGSDSFTFKALNGTSESNVATISVTITAVPDSPIANHDSFTVAKGSFVSGNVLSNDTNPDGPVTLAVVAADTKSNFPLAHGTLTLNTNGSFAYTHNGDNATTDSFTYRATNGSLNSSPATVTITINQPPVASNGCKNTAWNTPIDIDLKTLVTDPNGPANPTGFAISAQGMKGNATVGTDGIARYTPIGASVTGGDSFTYQYTDPLGGAPVSGQVTVAIGNRIMPLGDSITAGVFTAAEVPVGTVRVGYRRKLYNDLTAGGKNAIDFVGQYVEGSDAVPAAGDAHHEGRLGLRDEELATQVSSRLSGTLNDPNVGCPTAGIACTNQLGNGHPDIVLLHIGTNGIDNTDNNNDATDVQTILNNINSWSTANGRPVTVLLAKIIGSPNGTYDANAVSRNTVVASMAQARPEFGSRLFLVDMYAALGSKTVDNDSGQSGDFADLLHPDTSGYEKMANTWRNALETNRLVCP